MDNKYYTPDLSEFHIGFEFEHEIFNKADDNPNDPHGKHWMKTTIERIGDRDDLHLTLPNGDYAPIRELAVVEALYDVYVRNTCRVKYLDAEDVDSLGWSRYVHPVLGNVDAWYIGNTRVIFWLNDDRTCSVQEPGGDIIFYGRIKNKSELIKLVGQLILE